MTQERIAGDDRTMVLNAGRILPLVVLSVSEGPGVAVILSVSEGSRFCFSFQKPTPDSSAMKPASE